MTRMGLAVALTAMIAASGASAASLQWEQGASPSAPAGSETTRYCLRVDPITGSRMETVQCYTRAEWAQLEVDVDKEWAANGVKTLG